MRIRRRRPDYEHIAEMERDIASLPVPTLDERIDDVRRAQLEARRDPDWSPGSGVVLGRNTYPIEALSQDPALLELSPGFRWPVANHDDVRPYIHATSCSLSATPGFYPPRSRIVVATR